MSDIPSGFNNPWLGRGARPSAVSSSRGRGGGNAPPGLSGERYGMGPPPAQGGIRPSLSPAQGGMSLPPPPRYRMRPPPPPPVSRQPGIRGVRPMNRAFLPITRDVCPRPPFTSQPQVNVPVVANPRSAERSVYSVADTASSIKVDDSSLCQSQHTKGDLQKGDRSLLCTRPQDCHSKVGLSGNQVKISSNHFKMKCKTGWNLLHYHVSFDVDEDRTYMRKLLVRQVEKQLPPYIFDGSSLFTVRRLVSDDSSFKVSTKMDDGKITEITMKLAREVSSADYSYLQFFNILLRRCMEKLDLQVLDRNYYDPKEKIVLKEHKLELWPGYITSIRRHENEVLLCCEISHKILRTDTVYEQFISVAGNRDMKTAAAKIILGQVVITRYNNKTYKIDDIDWDSNPNSTFPRHDGSQQSFADYYKSKYNIQIKDLKQPMIVSLPRDKDKYGGKREENKNILLVPELCYMTGLSEEQRSNFHLMKSLSEYTIQDPAKRCESLKKFADRLHRCKGVQEEMSRWDVEFEDNLVSFQARSLRPEIILQGDNKTYEYTVDNADWGNVFRNFTMVIGAKCDRWIAIYPDRAQRETEEFIGTLIKVSNKMGFKLANPKYVKLNDVRVGAYVQELKKALSGDVQPQILMVVVPNANGDAYSAVKKICCVDNPVISQVMTAHLLKKPKGIMSVATKVAVQMATKLGAVPWGVTIPIKNTMVIGYDSYHDASVKGKSVGAVVSSINESFTRFISSVTMHSHNEELLNEIGSCIMKALKKYAEINGKSPSRIIVYRDGVGDGQIEMVKNMEIPAIKDVFRRLNISPKFAYIIVSKRINTRFFLSSPQRPVNPSSGTVIDSVVTLPERYDFFLVSQSVRRGTVNPTSYNVIEDESGLTPDHLQKLTYKLTHLYYNWPGTVRVPSVCQYAHKLAYLVGTSIHKHPHPSMDSTLYYL